MNLAGHEVAHAVMNRELTREELFLLVWDRPSQEVARDLGISDVALGKRCKKLQVPKPPPGYWAKVKAGKHPRKPILKEFSEHLVERQKARAKKEQTKQGWLHLSPLQADIFRLAVDELSAAGVDLGGLEITQSGARALGGDIATQILLLIQKRHVKWLEDRSNSDQVAHPSIRSVQALVSKLLPLAKSHVLLLERKPERHNRGDRGPQIVIRLSPEFIQQVANLRRVVEENRLSHAVWDLAPFEHAWIVQYHYNYDRYVRAHSQLCVSQDTLWAVCRVKQPWDDDFVETFETAELPLSDIAPIELVPIKDVVLPKVPEIPKLAIPRQRIEAFMDIDHMHDILSSAIYRHDYPAPDDHLVLLEKIYLGSDTGGPLTAAKALCKKLEDDMEKWELALSAEREAICGEALGLGIGDTILTESRGKTLRLKIEQMSAYVYNDKLNFHISGKRYRKDGVLGKRDESICLQTDCDFGKSSKAQ